MLVNKPHIIAHLSPVPIENAEVEASKAEFGLGRIDISQSDFLGGDSTDL